MSASPQNGPPVIADGSAGGEPPRTPRRRTLTLRARLTVTVLVLAGIAILVVGVATHKTLESFLMGRVDEQLQVARVAAAVAVRTGLDLQDLPSPARPAGEALLPPGTYAELRHGDKLVNRVTFRYGLHSQPPPDLPAAVVLESADSRRPVTVDSRGDGSLRYRAQAWALRGQADYTLVVAVPLTEVDATLGLILWIEIALGAGVLALLVVAAWLLVRHELRPLDDMAATAGEIAAGDLTRRVEPAEPHTEVGRLGLALNAMLAQIEKAFAAREASEQRLRRFLADASHELRTPLTSIRGYAELFHRGADKRPQDLAVSMRRIEDEARRMGVLVNDLLLLARLDDQRPAAAAPVELTALVADGVQDARAGAPDRQIVLDVPAYVPDRGSQSPGRLATGRGAGSVDDRVTYSGEGGVDHGRPAAAAGGVWVTGDDHRLRQVVANLLSNAVRHTPAGSPVTVDLHVERRGGQGPPRLPDDERAKDGWAVLRVRDHGPGLSPEQVERVFEPFYRSDAGRSRAAGGAGLGLAIVKAIVDAHHGLVTVEDTPDGGATFVVWLPLRDPGSETARDGTVRSVG